MIKKLLCAALSVLLLSGCAMREILPVPGGDAAVSSETEPAADVPQEPEPEEETRQWPAFIEPDYSFQGGVLTEPIVVMDRAEELQNSETPEKFDVKILLTEISENELTLSVENRDTSAIRVTVCPFVIDGIYIDRYREAEVYGNSTETLRLDLPGLALRWAGIEGIGTVTFGEIVVRKLTDINGDGYHLTAQDLPIPVNGEPLRSEAPQGKVLWETERGHFAVLGVDYSDSMEPKLMVRMRNDAPDRVLPELNNYTVPSVLEIVYEVASVNGIPVGSGHSGSLSVQGQNTVLKGIILRGFEEADGNMPVGKVEEVVLRFGIADLGVAYEGQMTEEVTIRIEEDGLTAWGNPFDWMEHSPISVSDEWTAYYENQMQE